MCGLRNLKGTKCVFIEGAEKDSWSVNQDWELAEGEAQELRSYVREFPYLRSSYSLTDSDDYTRRIR